MNDFGIFIFQDLIINFAKSLFRWKVAIILETISITIKWTQIRDGVRILPQRKATQNGRDQQGGRVINDSTMVDLIIHHDNTSEFKLVECRCVTRRQNVMGRSTTREIRLASFMCNLWT